jgi:hypothetical protein
VNHPAQADEAKGMTDLAFVAAYMAACKGRPSDWNEIGYWYFRQAWQAAIKHERPALHPDGGNPR